MSGAGEIADVFDGYIEDVLEGRIVTGRLVRQVVERHVRDLEDAWERGLFFSPERAQYAVDFFSLCCHVKGEWARARVDSTFRLAPWQKFIVGSIFGWLSACGPDCGGRWCQSGERHVRRFRVVYIQVARKNGKTTLLAPIALYLTGADDEPGAEVYSAATKRDQAKICHSIASQMVKRAPVGRIFGSFVNSVFHQESGSYFLPLGADADTTDGLNPHGVIIDELHAHKTSALYDVLDTATGARSQPLLVSITTAGLQGEGICRRVRDYGEKVLDGTFEDDTFLPIVYELDEPIGEDKKGDDYWEEGNWIKANPNLGVSVRIEELRQKATVAQRIPSIQNSFLRKRLNVWTEQDVRAINMSDWKRCEDPFTLEDLEGQECYAGLDLSSKNDLTALALYFPGAPARALVFFWIPEDNIEARVHSHRVPYDVWLDGGFLDATPGNVIDYEWIRYKITGELPEGRGEERPEGFRPLAERFQIVELAYDRWGATQIAQQLLSDGINVIDFGQGYASMAEPTKELVQSMIPGRRITHNGDPVLTWNASNLSLKEDPAGNMKPDKSKSREKIDGLVALIMAIGRAISREAPGSSKYESEDVLVLG